jgi:GT2 family glycosyltransferase
MSKQITVIIPTYNRKNNLRNISNQLLNQTLNKGVKLEIVVVVDGSIDGTIEMLDEEYPTIHTIVGNGDWWFTKCINEGFKLGFNLKTDLFLLLNDDVEIDLDYISKLYDSYNSIGNVNCILGSISYSFYERDKILEAGTYRYNRYFGKYHYYYRTGSKVNPNNLSGVHKTTELSARGSLMSSIVVKTVNGYDEQFVQYGSDTDFCYSAVKQGYDIFISWDAPIYCHEDLTCESSKFNNPSFATFLNSLLSNHSSNALKTSYLFARKHFSLTEQLIIIPRLIIEPFASFILRLIRRNN